jgi:hypothetical protein
MLFYRQNQVLYRIFNKKYCYLEFYTDIDIKAQISLRLDLSQYKLKKEGIVCLLVF